MLEVRNLKKIYKTKGGVDVRALDDVSIVYPEKGLVFLLGKSGSGKSTLLNVTGGLDKPDSGEIIVKGRSSKDFTASDFDSYRNTFIGFIFQEYNILNEFNVEQNIALALQLQGKKATKEEVNDILAQVDLVGLNKRKPNTLSGGQKQRIAIARALIKSPEIIMADEPTGALDSNTGKQVFDTLKKLSKDKLIIVVSHDRDFAEQYGDRIIELKDGKIISDDSKNYKEPVKVSENVHIINDNTVSIKHGKELSDKDIKEIAKILKSSDGEVVITSGDKNVVNTKKAIHLNDDGASEVFLPTVEEKNQRQYSAEEAKFIKSKMPFRSSFKMGASGLKTKPVRLVFTILLSIVSFTMFGVLSTFMMYNPSYTIAYALQKSPNDYEQINKQMLYTDHYEQIDFRTGEVLSSNTYDNSTRTRFGVSEVANLNNNHVGHDFAGVIAFSPWGDSAASLNLSTGEDYYYNYSKLSGFVDAGEAYMSRNGFNLTGTYPANEKEIAISKYTFNVLKHDETLALTDNVSSILDKTIKLSMDGGPQLSMKVSGVYDTGEIPAEFNALKNKSELDKLDSKAQRNLSESFRYYISKSYHALGYVSANFYETYNSTYYRDYDQNPVNSMYLRGLQISESKDVYDWDVRDDMGNGFYIDSDIADAQAYYTFYNKNGEKASYQTINDNQIYISYNDYQNALRNAEYNFVNKIRELVTDTYKQEMYPELQAKLTSTKTVGDEEISYRDLYEEACNRLVNGGGKGSQYPEGHSYEEDYAFVKDFNDTYYAETMRRNYLRNVTDQIMSVIDTSDPEYADFVNAQDDAIKLTHSLAAFNALDNAIKDNAELTRLASNEVLRRSAESLMYREEDFSEYEMIVHTVSIKDYSADQITLLESLVNKYPSEGYKTSYNADVSEFTNTPAVTNYDKVYYKNYTGQTGELEVVGFFHVGTEPSSMYGDNSPIITKNFALTKTRYEETISRNHRTTIYEKPADERYLSLITKTQFSEAQIDNLRQSGKGYKYELTNSAYSTVTMFISLVDTLKTVFLIVGFVVGGFAALMFANFISVSISNKKKEIGILRAVGARGNDVFKIFYSESFVIAAICVVFAIVSSIVTCFGINSSLQEGLGISALNFGPINVLIIIGVALLVSILSTFIPVFLAAKKPPVESIRAL